MEIFINGKKKGKFRGEIALNSMLSDLEQHIKGVTANRSTV